MTETSDFSLQSLKFSLSGPLQSKFADPWSRTLFLKVRSTDQKHQGHAEAC